jgi:RNA polymerase sigma factor (TIGR02999 family)
MRIALALLAAIILTVAARAAAPQKIVFARVFPNGGQIGLFVAARDGSGERRLVSSGEMDYDPVWSPDGQWKVFTSDREGSADLFRAKPDGTSVERLTDSPAYDDQAAFSPDGKQLAFVTTRADGSADLWTLEIASRRAKPLTTGAGGDFRPSWSPDGQWIAFSSDRGTTLTFARGHWEHLQPADVYIVHPDGSGLKRITEHGDFCGSPKWTADSRRVISYCMTAEQTLANRRPSPVPGNDTRLVSVDIATGAATDVPSGPGVKLNPAILSANEIAYIRKDTTEDGIYYTNGSRGPKGPVRAASWSPDGSRVVFHRRQDAPPTTWKTIWSRNADFDLALTSILPSFGPEGDRFAMITRPPAGSVLGSGVAVATAGTNAYTMVYQDPQRNVLAPQWSVARRRADRVCLVAHGLQGRSDVHRRAAAVRRTVRHAVRRHERASVDGQPVGRRHAGVAAGAPVASVRAEARSDRAVRRRRLIDPKRRRKRRHEVRHDILRRRERFVDCNVWMVTDVDKPLARSEYLAPAVCFVEGHGPFLHHDEHRAGVRVPAAPATGIERDRLRRDLKSPLGVDFHRPIARLATLDLERIEPAAADQCRVRSHAHGRVNQSGVGGDYGNDSDDDSPRKLFRIHGKPPVSFDVWFFRHLEMRKGDKKTDIVALVIGTGATMRRLAATHDVTVLLKAWRDGDDTALDALMPLVYDELRRIARRFLQGEGAAHSLQPTALVNEAFLRLVDAQRIDWQNRTHFLAMSARLMRRVLVDLARSRRAGKRGGSAVRVTLDEAAIPAAPGADVIRLDDALKTLAALDDRKSRVVEMRFFGGLTVEETATALNVSAKTVLRDWEFARAWLEREIGQRSAS